MSELLSRREGQPRRGTVRATYALSSNPGASAVAFYRSERIAAFRHNLLIGSGEDGGFILRVRLDPDMPTRIVHTERLLANRIGAVRALAVGPDGAIYVSTADTLARLSNE